jgi:hypothetical protein
MILEFSDSLLASTSSTAKEVITIFHAVSNNLRPTSGANRGEHGDRAFKAIKCVSLIFHKDFEGFVVSIAALVTSFHIKLLRLGKDAGF